MAGDANSPVGKRWYYLDGFGGLNCCYVVEREKEDPNAEWLNLAQVNCSLGADDHQNQNSVPIGMVVKNQDVYQLFHHYDPVTKEYNRGTKIAGGADFYVVDAQIVRGIVERRDQWRYSDFEVKDWFDRSIYYTRLRIHRDEFEDFKLSLPELRLSAGASGVAIFGSNYLYGAGARVGAEVFPWQNLVGLSLSYTSDVVLSSPFAGRDGLATWDHFSVAFTPTILKTRNSRIEGRLGADFDSRGGNWDALPRLETPSLKESPVDVYGISGIFRLYKDWGIALNAEARPVRLIDETVTPCGSVVETIDDNYAFSATALFVWYPVETVEMITEPSREIEYPVCEKKDENSQTELPLIPSPYTADVQLPEPQEPKDPRVFTEEILKENVPGYPEGIEVHFKKGSFELDDQTVVRIKSLAMGIKDAVNILAAHGMTITELEIGGFTSSEGPDEYNFALSGHRADGVVKRLKDMGIDIPMRAMSFGETTLILNPDGSENKEKSRRVVIKFQVVHF